MKRFLKTVLAASMIAFSVGITSSAIMGVGEYVDLGSIYIIRQDDSGIEF